MVVMMALAGLLYILLEGCVCLLRGREVSRLQRRSQGAKCLGQRAVCLHRGRYVLIQCTEIRLGLAEVSRLKILPQLLELALNLLSFRLPGLQVLAQRVS